MNRTPKIAILKGMGLVRFGEIPKTMQDGGEIIIHNGIVRIKGEIILEGDKMVFDFGNYSEVWETPHHEPWQSPLTEPFERKIIAHYESMCIDLATRKVLFNTPMKKGS